MHHESEPLELAQYHTTNLVLGVGMKLPRPTLVPDSSSLASDSVGSFLQGAGLTLFSDCSCA